MRQDMEKWTTAAWRKVYNFCIWDEGLAKNPVTIVKVVHFLVDFNQRLEEILLEMRDLFEELEVEGLVSLDQVSNISINIEELPTLQG